MFKLQTFQCIFITNSSLLCNIFVLFSYIFFLYRWLLHRMRIFFAFYSIHCYGFVRLLWNEKVSKLCTAFNCTQQLKYAHFYLPYIHSTPGATIHTIEHVTLMKVHTNVPKPSQHMAWGNTLFRVVAQSNMKENYRKLVEPKFQHNKNGDTTKSRTAYISQKLHADYLKC